MSYSGSELKDFSCGLGGSYEVPDGTQVNSMNARQAPTHYTIILALILFASLAAPVDNGLHIREQVEDNTLPCPTPSCLL